MTISNIECIRQTLDLVREGLIPVVEQQLEISQGAQWRSWLRGKYERYQAIEGQGEDPIHWDCALLLKVLRYQWREGGFQDKLPKRTQHVAEVLSHVRNDHAHQRYLDSNSTLSALDYAQKLLDYVAAHKQRTQIQSLHDELLHIIADEKKSDHIEKGEALSKLAVNYKLHRGFFPSGTPNQKLFLQLSVTPEGVSASHRPDLAIAFVIDTSKSMRARVPTNYPGKDLNKLDLVLESMKTVLDAAIFNPQDQLALVSFDTKARVVEPFTPASRLSHLHSAIHDLKKYSGNTYMGAGIQVAFQLLQAKSGSKRIVLLTDGETRDKKLVETISEQLMQAHIPVTVIGVGKFNESVLTRVADRTQGRLFDIVADQADPDPPSIPAHQLPEVIVDEVKEASKEVITDLTLDIKTVKGVIVNRVTRVTPQQTEVDLTTKPFVLGNVAHGKDSTFIIECTIPERPAKRIRLVQMAVSYQVSGMDYPEKTEPIDVEVEFTTDEELLQDLDRGVIEYVQQRNLEGMIKDATAQAGSDPAKATKTLKLAQNLTQRLNNTAMTKVLDRALDELKSNKTISLGTAKTMRMGSKTQVIQSNPGLPSEEDIHIFTGTGPVMPSKAQLVLIEFGKITDKSIRLTNTDSPIIIGKFDPSQGAVDINLNSWPGNEYLSRRHAELRFDGDWSIRDLGSTNGVFIRRKNEVFFQPRLQAATKLEYGDEIAFGNMHFKFQEDDS